mmetsp:Transcript_110486/g.236096  ORF Transcript_110486/g.236096 Transcript_110486/m.236096 type:complete len:517 (-) Transcript_110486:214-1764(-)
MSSPTSRPPESRNLVPTEPEEGRRDSNRYVIPIKPILVGVALGVFLTVLTVEYTTKVLRIDLPGMTLPKLMRRHRAAAPLQWYGCRPAVQKVKGALGKKKRPRFCARKRNTKNGLCREGLAWYTFHLSGDATNEDCSAQCLSKMLDLSGMQRSVDGWICMCGASPENVDIWGDRGPRKGLYPPRGEQVPNCELEIWQVPGKGDLLEAEMNIDDIRYIWRVMTHRRKHQMEDGPDAKLPEMKLGEEEVSIHSGIGFNRGCYPQQCSYGMLWPTKASDRNVYIPFSFEPSVGPVARSVVREAIREYVSKRTCIRFKESNTPPYVKVSTGTRQCAATIGYPGKNGQAMLFMGGCSTMVSLGSVIHELGHVIGMAHEQQRPDGIGQVAGRGPFLQVLWHNIAGRSQTQYKPVGHAYVGSEGKYAPYDYESIMSYSSGGNMKMLATNAAYTSIMGQRAGLSDGDVRQINDMYQCGKPPPAAVPSPQGGSGGRQPARSSGRRAIMSQWALGIMLLILSRPSQ